MAGYRELNVWGKAMDLVIEVYRLCKYLPKEETYGLSDQMRRSAVSIASNIAEGQARGSNKDFIRFLSISQGSRAELDTQLEICRRLKYIPEDEIIIAKNLSNETGRMMTNLAKKLQEQINQQIAKQKTANSQQLTTNS